jgi:hypothetical protein
MKEHDASSGTSGSIIDVDGIEFKASSSALRPKTDSLIAWVCQPFWHLMQYIK